MTGVCFAGERLREVAVMDTVVRGIIFFPLHLEFLHSRLQQLQHPLGFHECRISGPRIFVFCHEYASGARATSMGHAALIVSDWHSCSSLRWIRNVAYMARQFARMKKSQTPSRSRGKQAANVVQHARAIDEGSLEGVKLD